MYNYSSDWVQGAPYWTQERRSNYDANSIHFFVNPSDGGYVGYMEDNKNDQADGRPGMQVACKN